MDLLMQNRSLAIFLLVIVLMFALYVVAEYIRRSRRRLAQRSNQPALTQYLPLDLMSGAITAREVLAAVTPHVAHYGSNRQLVFLSAGESVDDRGRSERWELWFNLPSLDRLAMCQVEPGEPEVGGSKPPLYLSLRVRPAVPGSALVPLPERFVDSPDAVAALTTQGVDFVAGDLHTLFQVKSDRSGKPAWYASAFDKEYYTPFER